MPLPQQVWFQGGSSGEWLVTRLDTVIGVPLADVERVAVFPGPSPSPPSPPSHSGERLEPEGWTLRGVVSNERYIERDERDGLVADQSSPGRPEATMAALIPIRKNDAWWGLAQDERRAIFAEASDHIRIGQPYVGDIARRLHHCRDLLEPFDFVTWFEYPPAAAGRFEELVAALRATPEWAYVDREVDVRLERATGP